MSSIAALALAFVVRVGATSPAAAAENPAGAPAADAQHAPRMIVLSIVKGIDAAQRDARRAGKLLGYPLAPATMVNPATNRHEVGAVITLIKAPKDTIAVTSYLGSAAGVDAELGRVQAHFPKAFTAAMTVTGVDRKLLFPPTFSAAMLVIGRHKTYRAALAAAQAFSAGSGIAYDAMERIYDRKRGLIYPDTFGDLSYESQYNPRRYDPCGPGTCVTVERSETYEGFGFGAYLVVAGIVHRDAAKDLAARLQAARKVVPSAYVAETTLYVGRTIYTQATWDLARTAGPSRRAPDVAWANARNSVSAPCAEATRAGSVVAPERIKLFVALADRLAWNPDLNFCPAQYERNEVGLTCGPDLDGDGDRETIVTVSCGGYTSWVYLASGEGPRLRAVAPLALGNAEFGEQGTAWFAKTPAGKVGVVVATSTCGGDRCCPDSDHALFELAEGKPRKIAFRPAACTSDESPE